MIQSYKSTKEFAKEVWLETMKMAHHVKASHIGEASSMIGALAVLYLIFL